VVTVVTQVWEIVQVLHLSVRHKDLVEAILGLPTAAAAVVVVQVRRVGM